MKVLAFVTLLLTLPGCGPFRRELPPRARPAPAVVSPAQTTSSDGPATIVPAPPPAPASAAASAPPAPLPPVGAPAPSVPPRPPAPQAAPSPARAPVPAAATTATPAASPVPPSPPLTATLPPAEVRRLQGETNRRIEETERLLRQLDGRPLAPKDLEMLRLAQGLVEQARRALGGQEYERAANLAAKARTLADDLNTRR